MATDEIKARFPIDRAVRAVPGTWTFQVPRQGIKQPNNTGTVTAYGRGEDLIQVRRTGQKISQTYAAKFWEPIE